MNEEIRNIVTGSHLAFAGRPPRNTFEAIAEGIVYNFNDRRGIKNGFAGIDEEVRREIIETTASIIAKGIELGMPPLFDDYDAYRAWIDEQLKD